MARFWTSPNSCAYVDDEVFITVEFPQPIPEPDFDILFEKLTETARSYAVENGGIVGKRYRIDEDELEYEDNPTVIIDGLQYVTYTGTISIFCQCEHGESEGLTGDIEYYISPYQGRIKDFESHGCY